MTAAAAAVAAERAWLQAIPKVELHCHFMGTLRPATAAELARTHGVELPIAPAELYPRIESPPLLGEEYGRTAVSLPDADAPDSTSATITATATAEPDDRVGLLAASEWLAAVVQTPDDFARVAYEAQQDAFAASNVVYRELFFEPGWFLGLGVAYRDVVDGLVSGLRAAEADFGVVGRLVAGIDRQISAAAAVELVGEVVAEPRAEVIGIGLEGSELSGPPERFAEAYALAGRSGLHRTAHAGEHVPTARYVLACLDVLGCERIDHGYFVLEDPAALARCREGGVIFTCAFTTSRKSWIPWRRASVRRMVDDGLAVTLGSDDPAMFPTTLTAEYVQARELLGFDLGTILKMARHGIEASWASPEDQCHLHQQLATESARLAAQHGLDV
jgi:adenosine deaminase